MGSQLACFLGFQTEEQYLRDNCTQLDAFRAANTDLPGNARILLVGEPRVYGLDRDPVVEDQFRTPLLVELAESTTSSAEIGRRLRERGITHILWNAAEAERIAAADGRSDFFACSSSEARDRLDRFLTDGVAPIAEGRWWTIGVVAEN
jgi:hypothetical protein